MTAAAPEPMLGRPLGQGPDFDRQVRLARELRLPHALTVEGPRGIGKSTAARYLAAALLCPEPGPEPCGQCRQCRKVATGNHPDLHWIEVPEDKKDIPVDAVRELRGALARMPLEGRARVTVFDPGDRLNEQGQNALLKTLEEPGSETFLLVTAARPERLLDTVRSRVARLRLRPLPEAVVREKLDRDFPGRPAESARAARLARGCLGRARELLTEHAVQMQDLVSRWLAGDQGLGAVAAARAVLAGAKDRAQASEHAGLFLYIARALLREALRDDLERQQDAAYAAPRIDPWSAQFDILLAAETDLEVQIPADQVLTGVFLQWMPGGVSGRAGGSA